jgi:large subunit ribosomal protein L10
MLVDYKGLTVLQVTELRSKLREAGVQMEVVKNTLLRRACEGTDTELMGDLLQRPECHRRFQDDPVAPAKILWDFAKDNDKLEIKGAALAGKLLAKRKSNSWQKCRPRKNSWPNWYTPLNAVPTNLVNVLSGVPRAFVNVLNAVKDQKDAA